MSPRTGEGSHEYPETARVRWDSGKEKMNVIGRQFKGNLARNNMDSAPSMINITEQTEYIYLKKKHTPKASINKLKKRP